MLTQIHAENQRTYGVIFIATLISCFIAFVNLFPLVYPDTGTYIHSGFSGILFYDRPIFYGLFIRYVSFGVSLWNVVLVQGFLISYMVYLTLGMFFKGLVKNYLYLGSITLLTLASGLSFTVSILIPDIFSAISILALANLLLNSTLRKAEQTAVAILYLASICMQFSTIPIHMFLLFLLGLYAFTKWVRKETVQFDIKRFYLSLALFLSALIILPLVHYQYSRQFIISGSNHIFGINHLLETGILEEYLDKNCDNHSYKICEYKDSLGWDFIWADNSPLQKSGGWEANRKEYKMIIKDIVTTPRYFGLLSQKGIEYSLKQFFTFGTSVSPPQLAWTAPFEQVIWRFPDSRREYISSLQSQNKLDLSFVNKAETVIVLGCIVFLLLVLLSPALSRRLNPELRWLTLLVMANYIISAVLCSNLSTIHPRFQNRLAWLFPLLTIIIVANYFKEKKQISDLPGVMK